MVHRIVFWTGFGVAVRIWQLGIELRPIFNRTSLWVYPIYGGIGASFGYWVNKINNRQKAILAERKQRLLEMRQRRVEKEALKKEALKEGTLTGVEAQVDGAVHEEPKKGGPIQMHGTSWGR